MRRGDKMRLYMTIEKMFPYLEIRIKLDEQMEKFYKGKGMFSLDTAMVIRERNQLG